MYVLHRQSMKKGKEKADVSMLVFALLILGYHLVEEVHICYIPTCR